MDEYLNAILNSQNNLENFEAEHLRAAVSRDNNLSSVNKRALMAKIDAVQKTRTNGGTRVVTSDPSILPGNTKQVIGAAAEFALRIVRNQSKIGAALPVVCFLSDFLSNEYRQIIANFLPVGVTLTSVQVLADRVKFTFTDGGNTDDIDVFCNTSAYPSFLNAMNSTAFQTVMARMKYSTSTAANTDTDAEREFGQTIIPYKDTNFGVFGGNRYSLASCDPPDQFKKNIIDISGAQWWLTPRQGIIVPMVDASVNTDVSTLLFNFWVGRFDRTVAGE